MRDRRCYEAYNIQVQGLVKRLTSAGINKVVVGISGGLDSTQSLIVAARAMDLLDYPRTQYQSLHHAGLCHEYTHADQCPRPHGGYWL